MIEDQTKMLIATIQKLLSRGARHNVQRILAKTHQADIAAILHGLDPDERFDVLTMEPSPEKRAEIFSYLDQEIQQDIINRLDKNEVIKLVDLMESDDAADLLGNLPEQETKEILASMVQEDSRDVADLMGYPEDSAGGLMSSDYLALHREKTVGDAIQAIQDGEDTLSGMFYVYVINSNEQLVGVVSLKQLLLTKRTTQLQEIMQPDVITVTLDMPQQEVAKTVERYDFLSVPVVNSNNRLEGVITVDDVIDVIREEAAEDLLAMGRAGAGVEGTLWDQIKARTPWLLFAFVGGCLCFIIVFVFGYIGDESSQRVDQMWIVAAFLPMILSIGATAGSQSAAVTIDAIRAGWFELGKMGFHVRREISLSVAFGLSLGVIVLVLSEVSFGGTEFAKALGGVMLGGQLGKILGGAVLIQVLVSMLFGSFLPIAIHRAGMDPTVGNVPLFTAVADLSAVAVLFGLLHAAT
ncbi:MAG: magnesium transporter [Bdellovibrionales bacterium]|nr:magnesium transporter [Bdellovibrionales bacterium]